MSRLSMATAIVCALVLASLAPNHLLAQQPVPDRAPLTYRRIFVPQEELETQVKGLLPVKREEFQRRLAAAGKTDLATNALVRIASAQYSARLDGRQLVDGQARWEVAAPQGTTGLLSLEPCNLALGRGTWDEMPPRRAAMGIGPRNRLLLQVDKPGTVLVPWSRAGQETDDRVLEFNLEFPPASLQQLVLRLPETLQLTAEGGLVSHAAKSDAVAAGEAEWLVELGGISRTKLRITGAALAKDDANLLLVKEQASYALMPTDVTADFQWQLDVHGAVLKTASLKVDPRLKLTAVALGNQRVAWSLGGDETDRTLSVEFPQPLASGNYTVSMQGVAEIAVGQPWRLPRITWEGAVWQEGSASINVPPSMQFAVTSAGGCRATKGAPLTSAGESLSFQYYDANGYVEIETLPRQTRMSSTAGVTIQFDATQVSATMRSDLACQEGEAFEIDAVVSNEWILDSLEAFSSSIEADQTVAADLLEDRPIVAQDERTRTMRLKFQRPITPQRPVRLVARARRQQPLGGDFSAEALWRWFRPVGTIERPTVMALRSNIANYDLQVSGDMDVVRLDPEASSLEELALLDAPPSGLLLRLPPEASDFRVHLRAGEPRYSAVWDVTAGCSRNRLREDVSVRCVPTGPGLSRLTLRSTPPPGREIRWRLVDIPDATVVAQTRRDTSATPANPTPEAVWELEFNRPLAQPFTLESTWEAPRMPRQALALFACLDATTQSGTLRVNAEDNSRWSLTASGPTAVPIPLASGRFTATRGLFRYEPGQRSSLIVADESEEELLPLARVRRADLSTQFAADGSALNVLTMELENTGLAELPLRLPSSAVFQEAAVQQRHVEPLMAGSQPGNLRIPLPPLARQVALRISYATTAQTRPIYLGSWRAHLPTLPFSAPSVAWHIELPPGLQAMEQAPTGNVSSRLRDRFGGIFLDDPVWTRWLHPWRTDAPLAASLRPRAGMEASSAEPLPEKLGPGWLLVSRREPWSQSLSLRVYAPERWALLALTLALTSAALAAATARRWPAAAHFTCVALAAATLTAPLAAAPPLAGAFWGVVAGCAFALVRPLTAGRDNGQPSRATTTRWLAGASASAIMLLAALLGGGALRAGAAPPDANDKVRSGRGTTHRVVIPIDDERQPAGDYVFVDDLLYDWIFRQSEDGRPEEPWQLRDAVYEVRWPDPDAGRTQAAEIRASLEIETFADNASVTLPFRRQQALLQQGGARLDGMPLSVSWHENGIGLTAVVPSPGQYRLDLSFSVPLKDGGPLRELALAIPRSPHAVARVNPPESAGRWESATALGWRGNRSEVSGSSWHVDLGAAAELTLKNASTGSTIQDPQAVEAEQLFWWKVRPGSVVVDALCKFRPLTGSLREVQLRFDPHLRLLPLDLPPAASRHWVEPGTPSTLHVALAEPAAGEFVIRPRFLLAGASGVGKLVPPYLEAVAGRISRRWMAVSAGPGLESATAAQPNPASVAVTDFAQAMGIPDALPQAAFDLAVGTALPELEFRPEMRQASATSDTTVVCGLRSCRLRFQAELSGLSPQHLQQRIALPPGWSATQVVVREGDLPVRSHWFQQADGTVVVRLDQPPGAVQRLQVDATISIPSGAAVSSPAVRVLEAADAGQTLRVYRNRDCEVKINQAAGWTARDEAQIDRHQDGLGRLVASLRGQDGSASRHVTIQITPNRPQVSARLMTRSTRPTSQGADVVVVCDLSIGGGKLDALRLEAPPDWSGPWQTSPSLAVQTAVLPGQARRHVTLIPDVPLTGKAQLIVRAPLRPGAGEPLRVPDIAILDLPEVERLVQLPKTAEGEAARWRFSGLQAAALPQDLRSGPWDDDNYETLIVSAPHFDAVLSSVAAEAVEPLVSLAEYRGRWEPSGAIQAQALFHLDVAGRDACWLTFPTGYRPAFATLDGIPAEIAADGDHRWKVRLPGPRLPQRLVVTYNGSAEAGSGKLLLAGPTLEELPAKATIWSLAAPNSLAAAGSELRDEGEEVKLDQDLLRLSSTAELLKRASERDVTGISSDTLSAWLRPWRIDAAAAWQRASSTLRTLVKDDGTRAATLGQVQAQLDRHLQALPGGQQPIPQVAASAEDDDVLGGSHRLGGVYRGQQSCVELTPADPDQRDRWDRIGIAILFVLLGAAAWLLALLPAVRDWMAASSPFLAAVAGMALACLSPLGVAALAITLISLGTACRSPWRRRSAERHSSVVTLLRHS